MTTYKPTAERVWWKHPLDRVEITWVALALLWCLIMFAMMVGWHFFGEQNLSNEAYKITPEKYQAKAQAMVDEYQVGEKRGIPVVAPPAGSDIYLIARRWSWWPIFELEKGKSYRLHLSSMDWQHGFSLQPENINIQVLPGYEHVVNITPDQKGEYSIICNEYCGIGHHQMVSKLYVK